MLMNEDTNPMETREWLDALDDVVKHGGPQRASFLLLELARHAMGSRLRLPAAITTPFCNTIAPSEEKMMPGDVFMERRIRSLVRWNALAMVMRGNDNDEGLGGHISSFSSCATLYDVGFNHFFRGTDNGHPGDLVFYQGHSAPGMYARSFLEGRLDEAQPAPAFSSRSESRPSRPATDPERKFSFPETGRSALAVELTSRPHGIEQRQIVRL